MTTVTIPECAEHGCKPMEIMRRDDGSVVFHHEVPGGNAIFVLSSSFLERLDEGQYIQQVVMRTGMIHRALMRN